MILHSWHSDSNPAKSWIEARIDLDWKPGSGPDLILFCHDNNGQAVVPIPVEQAREFLTKLLKGLP